jgi:serine/threonine protein kinase
MSLGKIVGEPPSQYKIVAVIGNGAFSTVYRCYHLTTKEQFAVKVIAKQALKSDPELEDALIREINSMQVMRPSEFVVQLHDSLVSPRNHYLVMDLVTGGTLMQLIQKSGRGLYPNQARLFFRQILRGLGAIHGSGVVHRDIKPENMLLDSTHSIVKISDFGFGCYSPPGRELRRKCGTLRYSAPEIFTNETYQGREVDIWAAGVTLYVMLFNAYPFHAPRKATPASAEQQLIAKICSGTYDLPRRISPSLEHLLSAMLRVDPRQRWTLEKIRNHAWVMGIDEVTVRIPMRQKKPTRNDESPLSSSPPFTGVENQLSDNRFLVKSSLLNTDESDSDVEYMQGGSHRRVRSCPTLPTFLSNVLDHDVPMSFAVAPLEPPKKPPVKLPCLASEVTLDELPEPSDLSRPTTTTTASLGRPPSLASFELPSSQPQSPVDGGSSETISPSTGNANVGAQARRSQTPSTLSTPPLHQAAKRSITLSLTPTKVEHSTTAPPTTHDKKRFEKSLFLKRFGVAHLRILFNLLVFCVTLVIVGSLRVLFNVDALQLPLPRKVKDLLEQFLKPPFEEDDIRELNEDEIQQREHQSEKDRRSPTPQSPRLRTKASGDSIHRIAERSLSAMSKELDGGGGLRKRTVRTVPAKGTDPTRLRGDTPLSPHRDGPPTSSPSPVKRVTVQEPTPPPAPITPAMPLHLSGYHDGVLAVPDDDERQLLQLHCDSNTGDCFAIARSSDGSETFANRTTKVGGGSTDASSTTASPFSMSPASVCSPLTGTVQGMPRQGKRAMMRAVASHVDLSEHQSLDMDM